jgi:hypothetical protein
MKTRILELKYHKYSEFIPQTKLLWWWMNCSKINSFSLYETTKFYTHEEAVEYINNRFPASKYHYPIDITKERA